MGTVGIRALLKNGFEILKVYTHEDDKGEDLWFESVRGLCREKNLNSSAPPDVNAPAIVAEVRAMKPDIIFSFYYRKMLKPELLALAPQGALNLHGSLLPKYRGRCPLNWVLVKGENRTGVTLHYMVEKPDAGDIVGQAEVPIAREDTARTLYDKLALLAAEMLDEVLPKLREGCAPRRPMDLAQGSYFGGRKPEDGRIDWNLSCWEVYNLVRAVTRPWPGAFSTFMGEKVMIWMVSPDDSAPGLLGSGEIDLEDDKVHVGTRFGSVRLVEIEWRGQVLAGPAIAKALGPYWREKFN
jgi:UDP-4-amino-4-deoxy-L-arabinose formyltransferase/UDP-glucuronic acid dehydrogenase (UDP-4-keto-hexauronic acid decarboxylating)